MAGRALFIQLRQLGDIILTTPAIREFKKARPDWRLDFLAHPMGKLILAGNPAIDNAYYYDPNSKIAELKLIGKLRQQRYDLVVDFMSNPRSATYTFLAKGGDSLAFDSRRRFAYQEVLPRSKTSDYIVREKFRLLTHLGITAHSEALDLPWGSDDAAAIRPYFAQDKFSQDKKRIILSPTHRRSERQWPKGHYGKLAAFLSEAWQAEVFWIWGPGEESFVKECQAQCPVTSHLAPATTFRQLAAFIAQCDMFIGNSNGPSHVAVAVDTPSLQIHGPTQATAWCPFSPRHQAVFPGLQPHDTGDINQITLDQTIQGCQKMAAIITQQWQNRLTHGGPNHWRESRHH